MKQSGHEHKLWDRTAIWGANVPPPGARRALACSCRKYLPEFPCTGLMMSPVTLTSRAELLKLGPGGTTGGCW